MSELRVGDPVTVAYWTGGRREMIRAEVASVLDTHFFWRRILAGTPSASSRLTADEGVTWARGWDGPATDALRAAVALTA